MAQMLYVLGASYDKVEDALADYDAVVAAYSHIGSSPGFDATVVARDESGKVEVVRRHDEAVRQGRTMGAGWGLAIGAVAAIFPAIGLVGGLIAGGGIGALLGAKSGRANNVLSKDDLKALGETLEQGDAGLVVVYAQEMAGRIASEVTRSTSTVRHTAGISAEELAEEMRAAEAAHAPS
jgi:uncharacterized membrane protein